MKGQGNLTFLDREKAPFTSWTSKTNFFLKNTHRKVQALVISLKTLRGENNYYFINHWAAAQEFHFYITVARWRRCERVGAAPKENQSSSKRRKPELGSEIPNLAWLSRVVVPWLTEAELVTTHHVLMIFKSNCWTRWMEVPTKKGHTAGWHQPSAAPSSLVQYPNLIQDRQTENPERSWILMTYIIRN